MADYVRKIMMLGDPAVGKTSLVARFVKNMFDEKYLTTLGAKPSKKTMTVDGDRLTLMIWDIAGHRYTLHPAYYAGARGALIVGDVSRPGTFDSLETWKNSLTASVGDVPVLVLLNKADLPDRKFGKEDVEALGFGAVLTSAKTGENVELAFGSLAEMVLHG